MENKKEPNAFVGFLSGLLIFACFVGFCMFMFWVCGQIFGWKM